MSVNRTTVLILSSNPAFARTVSAHWPASANPPEFAVLDQELFRDPAGSHFDLAIADASSPESASYLKRTLTSAGKPAIVIHAYRAHGDHALSSSHSEGGIVELNGDKEDSEPQMWADVAGLVGREILRRSQAEARQHAAEEICANVNVEATLGRYMTEMRHNANNALTTVLGNAELLALEPGLPSKVIAQADTIRNMALRLNEIFQRFSSLEKELSVAARESGKNRARACAAGGR